ncbi:MAG: helix-turn-helix domain-containing protein [Enterocloster sp.]
MSSLAETYGLSPNYFSSVFKKKAGCNFVSYLTKTRIEKSKQLLLETDLTVQKIAEKVGYYSNSFFIRAFKKQENITPLEYRKSKHMVNV